MFLLRQQFLSCRELQWGQPRQTDVVREKKPLTTPITDDANALQLLDSVLLDQSHHGIHCAPEL